MFGAGKFSRALAKVLEEQGLQVILADPNWVNISQARMDGLSVYFGTPTTEDAKLKIDVANLGNLLICSPYTQQNMWVSYFFERY